MIGQRRTAFSAACTFPVHSFCYVHQLQQPDVPLNAARPPLFRVNLPDTRFCPVLRHPRASHNSASSIVCLRTHSVPTIFASAKESEIAWEMPFSFRWIFKTRDYLGTSERLEEYEGERDTAGGKPAVAKSVQTQDGRPSRWI